MAEAALQPGRGTQWAGFGREDWGRGSEAGAAAAAAAGPRRPGLAVPWQRLPDRPGAAGATGSGLGSRPGGLSRCCYSFLDFSRAVFRWGCLAGGRGIRKPKPLAVSGKRAPGDWGRETFTRPGALLRAPEPRAPAPAAYPLPPPDCSFLPGPDAHWRRLRGGGLNETQLRAKRLRLSRSWPPHPDSTHPAGGSGWGAPRPCSGGGGFFHYVEDAPAGMVGPAAPQPPTGPEGSSTQSSPLKSAGCSFPRPAPILALAASGPQVVRVQEPPPLPPPPPPPREREDAATRYPAPSASRGAAPAGRAGLVRAAVCCCGSSPSLRPPPLSARSRRPAPRSADVGHDLLRGYSGGHCAGGRNHACAELRGADRRFAALGRALGNLDSACSCRAHLHIFAFW